MSDWTAEGGTPEGRRFVQDWLDDGGGERLSAQVRDAYLQPLIISRQLYDRMRVEHPGILPYFALWEPPLIDHDALAEAVAQREISYRPPSAPLIPLDCIL